MKILSFVHCERVKLLRSGVFRTILAVFAIMPLMIGVIAGLNNEAADWNTYLPDVLGSISALLVAGFSFTACWVFGREYTDKTISELLVKPVSKFYVVLSKFIVIFLWDILLSVFIFAVVVGMGAVIRLDGGSFPLILNTFLKFFVTSLLIMVVSTTSSLLANVTKGYLAPIGMTFVIVILSNLVVQMGIGAYFPWTIPALILRDESIGFSSFLIVAITGIAGFVATVAWWRCVEQE